MLREAGQTPDVIDIRADGIDPQDRAEIVAVFGEKAINKASTTWRGLSDVEKALLPEMLLAQHPLLLKRPAIFANGVWTLGWRPDVQTARLGS